MKKQFYIIFLFFTFHSIAQNITEKTFNASNISNINIDGDSAFKIVVEAKPIDEITIHSRVEGENSKSIVLVTENKNNNLYITTKQQPVFKDANDKLSAHKVISIELIIVIPENRVLSVNTDIASIIVKGQYKKAIINSTYGNCFFYEFIGNAIIYTLDGNITLNTNNTNITATSKNGFVKKEKIDSGNTEIVVKTINGNITVNALTNSQ